MPEPHAPPPSAPKPSGPVVAAVSQVRAVFTWLGVAGIALVLGSAVMLGWAWGVHGIHCPECDRPPDMAFWTRYFSVKDALLHLGGLTGLAALIAAHQRRWGLIAVVAAFFAAAFTPL